MCAQPTLGKDGCVFKCACICTCSVHMCRHSPGCWCCRVTLYYPPLAIVWLCFSEMGFYPVHSVALIPCNTTVPDDVGVHRGNVCSTLPVSAV